VSGGIGNANMFCCDAHRGVRFPVDWTAYYVPMKELALVAPFITSEELEWFSSLHLLQEKHSSKDWISILDKLHFIHKSRDQVGVDSPINSSRARLKPSTSTRRQMLH
jgi:hypothetical protein